MACIVTRHSHHIRRSAQLSLRRYAHAASESSHPRSNRMSCWQVFDYGGPDQLKLSCTAHIPILTDPRAVLVRVHAVSVNPIDTKMIGGYGATLMKAARKMKGKLFGGSAEFPFIPGMDFSGEIVQTGKLVPVRKFTPGDEVWGTLHFSAIGSHAQYTLADTSWLSHKPKNLTHCEAASIPYVAATTWSSLFSPPKGFTEGKMEGKRVLVLGGSGGVGTFAIQLFKAWGAEVTVVCGPTSLERCLMLGADVALDYQNFDVKEELKHQPKFDLIYDLVGQGKYDFTKEYLHEYRGACYLSLVNPVLRNFDRYGLAFGALRTAVDAGCSAAQNLSKGRQVHWGMHKPSSKCMSVVAQLVEDGKIQPVIDKVFHFDHLPEAYNHAISGAKFGKVVVDFSTS